MGAESLGIQMIRHQAGFVHCGPRNALNQTSTPSVFFLFLSCLWSVKYIFREREGNFPFPWTSPKPHLTSGETKAHSRIAEPAGVTSKVQIQILVHLLNLLLLLRGGRGWQNHRGPALCIPRFPPFSEEHSLPPWSARTIPQLLEPLQFPWRLWNCIFPVNGGEVPSLLSSSPATWTEEPWILDRNSGSVFQEVSQVLLK